MFKFFKLAKVVGDCVHSLLTEVMEAFSLLHHFDYVILNAFLLNVPHELEVFSAADEDVAIIAGDEPVMKSSSPFVSDFTNTKDVAWVEDGLNAGASYISIVIEEVNLASYDYSGLIRFQKE